jgi:hypothetical protein
MKKIFSGIIVIFVFLYFINFAAKTISFLNTKNFAEPKVITNDEILYLQVFHLVKKGENYYKALPEAFQNDARKSKLVKDPFMWRPPTAYYFWTIFASNGKQIAILFWILAWASFVSIYFILKKIVPWQVSLFGPILTSLYFQDVFHYSTSFLFHEWWGWFFLIFALLFFTYKKLPFAIIFFTLSVLTRELFIISILTLFIYSLYLKKNRLIFIIPIAIFIIFFLFHLSNVNNSYLPASPVFSHALKFNKISLLNMFAFSMREFPLINLRVNLFFIIISFVTTFFCIFKKQNEKINYLLLSFWGLILLLPFAAQNYNDYWGIIFMPTLLAFSPIIFVLYEKIHSK